MYAVVRVRGNVNLRPGIKKTLELLRLHRVNHMVLVPESREGKGMLKKAESYIAFGEISAETLEKALEKRGRTGGNKRLDENFLKETKVSSFKKLAGIVLEGKKLEEFGIKPVFRLKPPKKGHKRGGIKKSYSVGGALGYRAGDINALLERMI